MPRFYLSGFADQGRITTVQLPGNRRFTQSIQDASVAKDYYAVRGHPDGTDVIEKKMAEIEGAVSRLFEDLQGGKWPLPTADRTLFAYFIALQITRVPLHRRNGDFIARQIARLEVGVNGKRGLRRSLRQQDHEVDDNLVDDIWEMMTRRNGPDIEMTNEFYVSQMIDTADALLKYLIGRPWTLIEFDQRSLLTSDSPVGLVPDEDTEPWMGVGFGTAWGVTFPITRKMGLLMSSPEPFFYEDIRVEEVQFGRFDRKVDGTTIWEKFFNHQSVAYASEWLYHHPEDARFIPEPLPEPNRVATSISSFDYDFDGAPWFPTLRPPADGRAE